MRGRRATPTSLKLLRGDRPSRINRNEPTPAKGRPPKPAHLIGAAAAEWDRLAQLCADVRVLTVADGPMLETACLAYAEMRAASDVIQKHGPTYTTKTATGSRMVRARPEVAIAGDAMRRYTQALGHFGLSPATRGKVAAAPEERPDRLARFLQPIPRRDPRRLLGEGA